MRSESPEPMVLDDEFRDTQVRPAVHLYTCTVHITGFCPDLRRGGLQGDGLWPGAGQGGQGEGGGRHPDTQVRPESETLKIKESFAFTVYD